MAVGTSATGDVRQLGQKLLSRARNHGLSPDLSPPDRQFALLGQQLDNGQANTGMYLKCGDVNIVHFRFLLRAATGRLTEISLATMLPPSLRGFQGARNYGQ